MYRKFNAARYMSAMATYLVAVRALLLRWRLVGVVLVVGLLALAGGTLLLVAVPVLWRRLVPVLRRWRSPVLLWRVLLARRRLLILQGCRHALQ